MQYGKVTYTLRDALNVKSRPAVAAKLGLTRQAVEHWDKTGKLPPMQAIRLHRDHGVPMSVLGPLVEGRK